MTYAFSPFNTIRNWKGIELKPVQSAVVIGAQWIVPLVKDRSLGAGDVVDQRCPLCSLALLEASHCVSF